ncbi:hypothetical protein [Morganella morganii IS15]|nr:hypothetical protein CSB69_0131 [Morganella morganii]EMP52016.1 hypothetical protein C790_00486 [Morganella morganii SC01]CDK64986.1 hypothetical protein [Morganella morganii IS15]
MQLQQPAGKHYLSVRRFSVISSELPRHHPQCAEQYRKINYNLPLIADKKRLL